VIITSSSIFLSAAICLIAASTSDWSDIFKF
jgi:hypothetical protein